MFIHLQGWDENLKKIITRATGSVKDKVTRDLEGGQRAIIDPTSKMIAMLLAEGLLKV